MDHQVTNPNEERHYFQWRKPNAKIEIYLEGVLIAESTEAILLKEVGKQVYDNVYYLPKKDVRLDAARSPEKQTHCPLKGDASYYDFQVNGEWIEEVGWTYEDPIKRSQLIKDHVAFYQSKVKTIIHPEK